MKKYIITLAALCVFSAAAFSDDAKAQVPPPPKPHHEFTIKERAKADAERIARDYGMNERQYKKVYRLLLKLEMVKEDALLDNPQMFKGPKKPDRHPAPVPHHHDIKRHKYKHPND